MFIQIWNILNIYFFKNVNIINKSSKTCQHILIGRRLTDRQVAIGNSICRPVYLSTCQSVYPSTCQPVFPLTCQPPTCLPVDLSTRPLVNHRTGYSSTYQPLTDQPVDLSTAHLSTCQAINRRPIDLSTCQPSICQPLYLPTVDLSTCVPVDLSINIRSIFFSSFICQNIKKDCSMLLYLILIC